MEWWIWIVTGLGCLVVEVLTPGSFVFIFFGLGAVAVGGLTACGLLPEFWQQSAAGVAVAAATLALFRGRLLRFATPRRDRAPVDTMIGEWVTATENIAVAAAGKVEFRGTTWTGYNAGVLPLAVGARGRIERVDGLTLWLKQD